jgi:ACR3 family arsenite efflux pump ArsB
MKKNTEEVKKPKRNWNIKQALEDLLDIAVGLSLVAGAYALWQLPAHETLFGTVDFFGIAAVIQIALVIWMFLSGKRYRNK